MKQQTLIELATYTKTTRQAQFLADMHDVASFSHQVGDGLLAAFNSGLESLLRIM